MPGSFAETFANRTMNLDLTKTLAGPKSITGLCTDLFMIVIRMREAEDLGEPEALRKLINHYLQLFGKNCAAISISNEAIDDAKFALVALIDETVLSIPGACRDYWLSHPLQLDHYGHTLSGQEFFTRLEKLMVQIESRREVAEVYYLCLSLGFEGKYKIANPEERVAIMQEMGLKLKRSRGAVSTLLSPHGYFEEKDAARRKDGVRVPLWAVAAAAAAICAAWYAVLFSMNLAQARQTVTLIQSIGL